MTGTFIDTIIICTLTGLTIIVSGVWTGTTNGAEMTQSAFATTYGSLAPFILTISLTLFAFTTIIDWNDPNGASGPQDGEADHVGIVEKCENGIVYTIEGNSGDACRQNQYPVGYYEILGYGILNP